MAFRNSRLAPLSRLLRFGGAAPVEEGLEEDLCGDGVDLLGPAAGVQTGLPQESFCLRRREALIPRLYGLCEGGLEARFEGDGLLGAGA